MEEARKKLEKTVDAEIESLLNISDSKVTLKLKKFMGNKDLEHCTKLGKLFKEEHDELLAKKTKINFEILKTTF